MAPIHMFPSIVISEVAKVAFGSWLDKQGADTPWFACFPAKLWPKQLADVYSWDPTKPMAKLCCYALAEIAFGQNFLFSSMGTVIMARV